MHFDEDGNMKFESDHSLFSNYLNSLDWTQSEKRQIMAFPWTMMFEKDLASLHSLRMVALNERIAITNEKIAIDNRKSAEANCKIARINLVLMSIYVVATIANVILFACSNS